MCWCIGNKKEKKIEVDYVGNTISAALNPSLLEKEAMREKKTSPGVKLLRALFTEHAGGGLILKGCRSKKNVTQKTLADALDISQHHISEMENGKRPIGKEMAKGFATVL